MNLSRSIAGQAYLHCVHPPVWAAPASSMSGYRDEVQKPPFPAPGGTDAATGTTRMPHVVLIALYYPPSRASGVYRALAMSQLLAQGRYRVTVITAPEDYYARITGSSDPSLLSHIDPSVRVERVRLPDGHLRQDIRDLGPLRVNAPRAVALLDAVRGKLFPDRYSTWIPGVVSRILALDRRDPVDAIIATGNPWSALEAGRIASRLVRAPLVLDFRDSWTLDQFAEKPAFDPDHPASRAERRVIEAASLVYQVNEPMREWYAERYPREEQKFAVLENGYDAHLVPTPPLRIRAADEPLVLGSVGTVTEHWPHEATWSGWELARQHEELDGARLRLYGHLGFSPNAAARIRTMIPGADAGVDYLGGVDKTDLAAVYDDLDVLVMSIPSSRYVTAGKVYECMAMGKPTVGIYAPEAAASGPMQGYPLAFPVSELTAPAVADAMLRAARAARELTPQLREDALRHARRYRRAEVLTRLDQDLWRLIDHDRSRRRVR